MFEQLLDPNPPDLGDGFRRRVIADGHRRQRRTRLAAGSAVLVPCVAIGGFAVYLRSQSDELERIRVTGLTPADDPTVSSPTDTTTNSVTDAEEQEVPPISVPINVLVAGVDRRPAGVGVPGSRADTIAVVRIDPQLDRVSILSLPRDLWVTTSNSTSARLNSFTEDGSLVTIVAELLDVDINHYVEVDFDGFESLIDIAGGVAMPFDQQVRDTSTGFEADAGCNELSGADALAYVRSRKLEAFDPTTNTWTIDPRSDIGRIARHQDLIQRVYTTVLSQNYDTTDKVRLLNDVVDDLTVDNGLDLNGVRAIFNAATAIGPDNFSAHNITSAITAEVIDGQSVLVADPDGVIVEVDDFLGRTTDAAAAVPAIADAVEPSTATC